MAAWQVAFQVLKFVSIGVLVAYGWWAYEMKDLRQGS